MLTRARRWVARRLADPAPDPAPAQAPAAHTTTEALLGSPSIAGKLLTLQDERGYAVVAADDPHPAPPVSALDGLPIPPTEELRLGYGASPEDYVASGRRDVDRLVAILRDGEHWGVDISAAHIEWCQRHLTPPMFFATTTTAPHLPFEDGSFDLVYGGSLFTHISDLADAWFLEVRRVLRPGGHAYLTIHDEHIVAWLLSEEAAQDRWMASLAAMVRRFETETGIVARGYRSFSLAADVRNQVQIFYDSKYLIEKWGAWATFVSATPGAYARQTALLFRK
jgi:SAM-dependent methyltransferase